MHNDQFAIMTIIDILIDTFPLFWTGVENLQECLSLSCNAISMGAWPQTLLQIFNPYSEQWKLIN